MLDFIITILFSKCNRHQSLIVLKLKSLFTHFKRNETKVSRFTIGQCTAISKTVPVEEILIIKTWVNLLLNNLYL